MTEEKIERILVEHFKKNLDGYNIKCVGTWQRALFDEVKGQEDAGSIGVLVVKVSPRQFSTPTVPDATFNCALALTLRADIDFQGKNYLEICDIIMRELQRFQQCYYDIHEMLSLPNEIDATGFQLGQGDTSIDQIGKTFGYSHTFTIFGIVDRNNWIAP